MHEVRPSRTALMVARRRAAHQIFDAKPLVFEDPLALPILGPEHLGEVERTRFKLTKPHSLALRAFLVARSRYAEEQLAHAVAQGVTQYVLLGAGLDTFAYRNPYPGLRVFEIDHPSTQLWKHDLLEANGIVIPESLTYVPVDFEHQTLTEQLTASGLDRTQPTLFAWLGVVPYLTLEAFRSTLALIAASPAGSGVVMDYGQPREALPLLERLARDSMSARVASVGEPFQLFFTPEEMAWELRAFHGIEDLGTAELNARFFAHREDSLRCMGSSGRIVSAWV